MGSPLWRLLEMLVPNCVVTAATIEISGQSVEIVCSSQAYADVDNSDIDLEPLLER
jgi:hypothetical protein